MTTDLAARVAQRTTDQPSAETEAPAAPSADLVDLAASDTWLRWLNERRTYFASALPRHIDEAQFIQAALAALYKTPKLQECKAETLMMALMQCAKFGLDPDGVHSAIVPYGKDAQFVPMYQGYIELMYRSGMIDTVVFDFIRDGDRWRYNAAHRPPDDFEHEPNLLTRHKGRPILAYAFAWMKSGGRSQVMFLNREEAEELRDTRSKAYQRAEKNRANDPQGFARKPNDGWFNSTWHTDFDAMWLKSPVRRLAKRVPTSPEIRELLKVDDQLDVMERLAAPVSAVSASNRPAIEAPAGDFFGSIEEPRDWPEVTRPGTPAGSEA